MVENEPEPQDVCLEFELSRIMGPVDPRHFGN